MKVGHYFDICHFLLVAIHREMFVWKAKREIVLLKNIYSDCGHYHYGKDTIPNEVGLPKCILSQEVFSKVIKRHICVVKCHIYGLNAHFTGSMTR